MALLYTGSTLRYAVGATINLDSRFVTSTGAGVTGLTVTLRIQRLSDSKYLKSDGTWTSSPSTEYTLTEVSLTNNAGLYSIAWVPPSQADAYRIRLDSGSATPEKRYLYAGIEVVQGGLSSLYVEPMVATSVTMVNATEDIEMDRDTNSPIQLITVLDANNAAVDVSGATLQFNIFHPSNPDVNLFEITQTEGVNGLITVGGASNNQVSVSIKSVVTATAGTYAYALRQLDGPSGVDATHQSGAFRVRQTGIKT